MIKIRKPDIFISVLGILACLPIILPYLYAGYFPTHDGEWAVVRSAEMFREIRDYQFPPRYSGVLNFGYGYPLFNFTYPFPYYLTTFLHFFKFGFVDSIKIIFAGSVIVSFFAMYVLSFQFWKNRLAGLLSAALYIYLPYRLVDLYVRGSIGESMAFALYPLIFIFGLFLERKKYVNISIFCISILSAIIITTHNISAVYFGIIFMALIIICFFSNKKQEALLLFLSLFWGILISAFFWMPALFEKQNILLSIIPIADRSLHYVTLPKLLFSKWGYGTPTDSNSFTFQLGIPQAVSVFLSIFIIVKQKNIQKSISFGFLILTLVFILMMFPLAFLIWSLPFLSEINYPWTLLLPVGFLMAFLGGGVAKTKLGIPISLILITLCIAIYLPWAKPESISNRGDLYYLTNEATTTSSNELMPLWVQKLPTTRFKNKVQAQGQISNLEYSSSNIRFNLNSSSNQSVTINQIYYPGWRAYVNGQEVKINYKNAQGLMGLKILQGKSNVVIKFSETPFRMGADMLSLVSFISLFVFFFSSKMVIFLRRKYNIIWFVKK